MSKAYIELRSNISTAEGVQMGAALGRDEALGEGVHTKNRSGIPDRLLSYSNSMVLRAILW